MRDFLFNLGAYLMLLFVAMGFLTICNWTYNPMDWNGFSRFILAVWVVSTLRVFFDN
jgi:hypothetical protein